MEGPVTFQWLNAMIAAIVTVGGAWFFIERRIKEVEKESELHFNALRAEVALLRETLYSKYVSIEAMVRLEERIVAELRELRRHLDKRRGDND